MRFTDYGYCFNVPRLATPDPDAVPFAAIADLGHETPCWVWQGLIYRGYGRLYGAPAHRFYYEQLVGPIADGLVLHHLCHQPLCVSPAHLLPLTRQEHRRLHAAERTHCKHGHEFTPENTRHQKDKPNARICIACARANGRLMKQKAREKRERDRHLLEHAKQALA